MAFATPLPKALWGATLSTVSWPAKLLINSEFFEVEVRASIEVHGYLYIFVDGATKYPSLCFFITPFVAEIIYGSGVDLHKGVEIEFSGNNLGYCTSSHSGHPEGTRENWVFEKNKISVSYFKNGVSLKFSGKTDVGKSYDNYNPENPGHVNEILEPIEYEITFFIDNTDLYDFLKGSRAKIDHAKAKESFVEALRGSSLIEYQGDN